MDSYDFYVLGTGNPLHPENQEEQKRTFEDVLENIDVDYRQVIFDYIEEIENKAKNLHSGFKTRCEMALDKLEELKQYSEVTENTYLNSRIKTLMKTLKP